MMPDGGKAGNTRLLSRKSVELMTNDQSGKLAPSKTSASDSVSTA
jgi:hypothetical protein